MVNAGFFIGYAQNYPIWKTSSDCQIVLVTFQRGMSRKRLDTLDDLARAGYSLRVTCEACGHVVVMDANALRERCIKARISRHLHEVERRLKCSNCSGRATVWPSLAEPSA